MVPTMAQAAVELVSSPTTIQSGRFLRQIFSYANHAAGLLSMRAAANAEMKVRFRDAQVCEDGI